jgi:hypothetical protein
MGRYLSSVKNAPAVNSSRPEKWATILFVVLVLAAFSGCGKSQDDTSGMSPDLISGQWQSQGKPAKIELVNNALVCTNENAATSRAEIKDGKVLVALEWNTSATLSPDGKQLRWDNNTVWIR